MTTPCQPTAVERHALTEMMRLMRQARGDHPALADVRREIATRIDTLLEHLRAAGIDVDALQDQIDTELDTEPQENTPPDEHV